MNAHPAERIAIDRPDFARHYMPRAEENQVERFIDTQSTVVVRGPPAIGRWWLMETVLGRRFGSDVVRCAIDMRPFAALAYNDLCSMFAARAGAALGVDRPFVVGPRETLNFALNRHMARLLAGESRTLLFILRHVDAIHGEGNQFFVWLRAWMEDPEWESHRLVVTMSINPSKLYPAVYGHTQQTSPFNLSPQVMLQDLPRSQIGALARTYGPSLSDAEVDAVAELVGGHPGMLATLFRSWNSAGGALARGRIGADVNRRLYAEHLSDLEAYLRHPDHRNERLAFERVQGGDGNLASTHEAAYGLEDMGLIQHTPKGYQVRYGLYRYLRLD